MFGYICQHCGHQSSTHEDGSRMSEEERKQTLEGYQYSLEICSNSINLGFKYKEKDYGSVLDEYYGEHIFDRVPPYMQECDYYKTLLEREHDRQSWGRND
jgi:hypothetical protein